LKSEYISSKNKTKSLRDRFSLQSYSIQVTGKAVSRCTVRQWFN